VKRYADVRSVITEAAATYAREVADGIYPGPEHSFE
jgi:3-methyl-2-oxobutanoate hydroxymethyltransferase